MRKPNLVALAAATLLAIPGAALAQAEPAAAAAAAAGDDLVLLPGLDELEAAEALERPTDQRVDDQELVRSTARLPVPLAEAPGIVTVIKAADIRAMGARNLYQALRYAPELDVTRDSFGFYHVAVRGRKVDAEVLVLLNGHRLNDFYDGRILYELPISLVERIEILRGPGSSLYGTNAFAGVISIYTRKRLGYYAAAEVSAGAGDRDRLVPNAFWIAAHAGHELRKLRVYSSLEAGSETGPKLLVPEDSLTRNRMDPDTGLSQSRSCDNQPAELCPDSAYSSLPRTMVRAAAVADSRGGVWRTDDSLTAGVHALYADKGPFLGEYDTLTPDSRLRSWRLLAGATYERPLRRDRSMILSTTTAVDLAAVDRDIQVAPDGFKELVEGQSELFPDGQLKAIDYTEVVVRQDLRFRWSAARANTLVVGAELEHTRMPHFGFETNYDSAGRNRGELGDYFGLALAQDGKTRTVLSLYAEDLYSAPHGVRLVAGGRFDLYSDFGATLSPRAGAVWRLADVSLKAFYGWAFRAPTFQELYDQTGRIDLGQFVGNSALDASKVQTFEAALLYTLSLDHLLLEITLTGAHSEIYASIDRAPLSGLTNTFLNTSDVSTNAASAEVRADLYRRLSLFANASWQQASADYTYIDPAQGLNIQTVTELANVPPYRFNAGLTGRLTERHSTGVLAEIGGRRKNNERTPLEGQHFFDYPPYAIVQVYAQADRVWNGLSVRAGVRNATNARVADEPFRANRMPLGIPRDRLRVEVTAGMDF
ncbi:MAG TPA: TonB-dependent receptor [Kofleriaceae bacterium]|nr:TonB-dependent receptor [Kofleriaceae bacterium]